MYRLQSYEKSPITSGSPLVHVSRENKGTDQLCRNCAADPAPLFLHMQRAGFFLDMAQWYFNQHHANTSM